MKKEYEFIIYKKYPENWDKMSENQRKKKEYEYDVASFFLHNYPLIKDFFEGADLCVEFDENPDFFVYSNEGSSKKLGLEITDCYIKKRNQKEHHLLSTYSVLENICRNVVKDIQKAEKANLSPKANYIRVTFTHEVMTGYHFDKNRLMLELKDFIINKNKHDGEYVCQVVMGYSTAYPEDGNAPKVFINSDLMYIVPHINDVVQIQKDAGVEDNDPVQRIISEKEKKLIKYKQECKYAVHKWWLCINVPKSAYMNPVSYHLPNNFKSTYDKIFLVTRSFYGCGIHLIYES